MKITQIEFSGAAERRMDAINYPELVLKLQPQNTAMHSGHTVAISHVIFGQCPNKTSMFCVEGIWDT